MYILYMYAVCKAHKQLYWGEIYINCTYLKLYDLTCIYACETNITIRILNASITPKSDLTPLIIPPSSSPHPTPTALPPQATADGFVFSRDLCQASYDLYSCIRFFHSAW